MIVTKSARVERDIDILGGHGEGQPLQRRSERDHPGPFPRTPHGAARFGLPHRRLETIRRLTAAGIPTGVMAAPMIPFLNDAELETILEHARDAGALGASYTMLRLPLEIADLFREWLAEALSRPRPAGHGAGTRHPRRKGLRLDVRPAHARHRSGGGAARDAVPARGQAIGVSGLAGPRLHGIRPPSSRKRSAFLVLRRPRSGNLPRCRAGKSDAVPAGGFPLARE